MKLPVNVSIRKPVFFFFLTKLMSSSPEASWSRILLERYAITSQQFTILECPLPYPQQPANVPYSERR
jgi:hypothetical protein